MLAAIITVIVLGSAVLIAFGIWTNSNAAARYRWRSQGRRERRAKLKTINAREIEQFNAEWADRVLGDQPHGSSPQNIRRFSTRDQ